MVYNEMTQLCLPIVKEGCYTIASLNAINWLDSRAIKTTLSQLIGYSAFRYKLWRHRNSKHKD